MAILTNSGRVAMAVSVKAQAIHLAWGAGDAAWDTTPQPEQITAEALVSEIGRRKATYVAYCENDVAGEIIVPTGRFTESATPTITIRELAVSEIGNSKSAVFSYLSIQFQDGIGRLCGQIPHSVF